MSNHHIRVGIEACHRRGAGTARPANDSATRIDFVHAQIAEILDAVVLFDDHLIGPRFERPGDGRIGVGGQQVRMKFGCVGELRAMT